MNAVTLPASWLFAAARCRDASAVVELARLAGAPLPVSGRTLRRLGPFDSAAAEAGGTAAPVRLSAEAIGAALELIDGTRSGVARFRLWCELAPRVLGARHNGRPAAAILTQLAARLGMSKPTVLRALAALVDAGLLRRAPGAHFGRVVGGPAMRSTVWERSRTHLNRSPSFGRRGQGTRATRAHVRPSPPQDRRTPGALTGDDVLDIFSALDLPPPSPRAAQRAAWRGRRRKHSKRTAFLLAEASRDTMAEPETRSAAGFLGWLMEQNRAPRFTDSFGFLVSDPSEWAGGVAGRFESWLERARRAGHDTDGAEPVVSGWARGIWWAGYPVADVVRHAGPGGYNRPDVCRALATQNGLWPQVEAYEAALRAPGRRPAAGSPSTNAEKRPQELGCT